MNKYQLQQHIYDIAADLNCEVEFTVGMKEAMMYVEENPPRIEVPTKEHWDVWPEKCYAISLHELGHVYHGHTQGRPPYLNKIYYFKNGVLKSEAEAWKFALNNSLIDWAEETMDYALNICLLSYFKASQWAGNRPDRLTNGNRHYHLFTWDTPDDYFWNVAKELGYETV